MTTVSAVDLVSREVFFFGVVFVMCQELGLVFDQKGYPTLTDNARGKKR